MNFIGGSFMKFSRIVAAGMFAAMLVGTMPVQANGLLDWLSGLFENNKPAQREQQRENRWQPQQPQAPQRQNQNRAQFRAPRGGMYGRTGQQRHQDRRPQTQQPAQPRPQQYVPHYPVRNNPRVNTVSKKEAFMKSLGLVGVGIAVTILFTQTGLVDKLRDLLGVARPARDVNNLATEFRETAEAVRNLGNQFMSAMDEDNNRRNNRNN